MRILLYSGGQERSNQKLHQALVDLTGQRRNISFTYVPFCHDKSEIFYRRAIKRYQKFGVSKFHCLDLDTAELPSADSFKKAFQSDIIYLPGGNTFYFLNLLKKHKLIPRLRKYAQSGGVIAGLSAGALILTPSIEIAGLKGLDPDKNEVQLKTLSSLNLVPFEFCPHFDPRPQSVRILKTYSAQKKHPIYASKDGGGIVVKNEHMSFYGKTWVFSQGEMFKLS